MILYVVQEENLKLTTQQWRVPQWGWEFPGNFFIPSATTPSRPLFHLWNLGSQSSIEKNVVTIQYVNLSTYFSIKQSIDSVNYWFNPHFLDFFGVIHNSIPLLSVSVELGPFPFTNFATRLVRLRFAQELVRPLEQAGAGLNLRTQEKRRNWEQEDSARRWIWNLDKKWNLSIYLIYT